MKQYKLVNNVLGWLTFFVEHLSLCLPQTCSRSLQAIRRRLRVW